jgi:MoaA/NifB/PqqE/SkfB family radical SAM enzyme
MKITRQTPPDFYFPFSIDFIVTDKCNLACPHCWGSQMPSYEAVDLGKRCEMLDILTDNGCVQTVWTGGEPLLEPEFPRLLRYAKERGTKTLLFTNATQMAEKAEEVLPYSDYISMSVDESDNSPRIRGSEQLDCVVKTFDLLKDKEKYPGKIVQALTVVNSINVKYLEKIGEFLREKTNGLNFHWKLNFYQPIGRFDEMCRIPYEDYAKRVKEMQKMFGDDFGVFYTLENRDIAYIFLFPDGEFYTTKGAEYRSLGNIFHPESYDLKSFKKINDAMRMRDAKKVKKL